MVFVPDMGKEVWRSPACSFLTMLVEHSLYQDIIYESR
jgi:hypothetical protein